MSNSKFNDDNVNYVYKILTFIEFNDKDIIDDLYLIGNNLDKKDKFIHLSTAKQVKRVVNKYFNNEKIIKLLRFDYNLIKNQIKWDFVNVANDFYPHSYQKIDKKFIVDIIDITHDYNFKELNY